jgi:hypothetical protein
MASVVRVDSTSNPLGGNGRMRSWLAWLLVPLLVGTLAACSSAADGAKRSDQPAKAESKSAPSPTPTAPAKVSFGYTDPSGYTATGTVEFPKVKFTSRITNAAPGFTDLVTSINDQLDVTNTTTGRNFDSTFQLYVFAVYPSDSTVCALTTDELYKYNPSFMNSMRAGAHCYLNLQEHVAVLKLGPGQSGTLPAERDSTGVVTPGSYTLKGVPEAAATTLLSDLNAPVGYAVSLRPLTTAALAKSGYVTVCAPILIPETTNVISSPDAYGGVVAVSAPTVCG